MRPTCCQLARRKSLLNRLIAALLCAAAGLSAAAARSFEPGNKATPWGTREEWLVKMPPAEDFCIFNVCLGMTLDQLPKRPGGHWYFSRDKNAYPIPREPDEDEDPDSFLESLKQLRLLCFDSDETEYQRQTRPATFYMFNTLLGPANLRLHFTALPKRLATQRSTYVVTEIDSRIIVSEAAFNDLERSMYQKWPQLRGRMMGGSSAPYDFETRDGVVGAVLVPRYFMTRRPPEDVRADYVKSKGEIGLTLNLYSKHQRTGKSVVGDEYGEQPCQNQ